MAPARNSNGMASAYVFSPRACCSARSDDGAAHGVSLPRELELLVEAGLTPVEALRAATSVPAGIFDFYRDRGRIAVGARADLLLVDGDPTTDIRETRALVHVYKRGVQGW
jgi:imidazolonepropionase-like amidohydrolase